MPPHSTAPQMFSSFRVKEVPIVIRSGCKAKELHNKFVLKYDDFHVKLYNGKSEVMFKREPHNNK